MAQTEWTQTAGMDSSTGIVNVSELVDQAQAAAADSQVSATDSENSATAAASSAASAEISATQSGDSATASAASAAASASSAAASATSATSAENNAILADASALEAANSESAAAGSAFNAAAAATNSQNSAVAAALSETNASASEASAASSASSAATSATQAATSATSASTSATSATASETAAAASQAAAALSEANAATSETNAANSATAAASSATSASGSATAANTAKLAAEAAQAAAQAAESGAASIFDQFGDQYLGSKASDPTVDNDGDPLTDGDIYWNTTNNTLRFYTGTSWVAPETVATTAANNAQSSASDAAASASSAAVSESNAATSASSASTSATNASNSESAAASSASSASSSAAAANISASNASASESAAALSETNAASSASSAATSATNASNSAASAASSASAASTSASNASTSETNASASESAAAGSASSASTSATNAANSASAASTSATNASNSASSAATSASNAATSATNASNSASSAAGSAAAAAASYDAFDDRYLGSKTSDPTVDNDGSPLLIGALYFNTTDNVMKVYTSGGWVAAYVSLGNALLETTTFSGDVSGTFNSIVVADDSHNHIIANVDGLQAALDAKQPVGSYITTSTSFGGDVSGTYNAIVIADDSHNHVIANVDGLQAALDGKSSTSHNHTLDSLSNTTITANTSGEILKWNGTAWINNTLAEAGIQPAGSYQPAGTYNTVIGIDTDYSLTGANVFSGLTLTDGVIQGVATRALSAGDIGAATSSHNHTLDSLSNTTITSNTAGEILKWNGTAWVNNTLAEAGIQPAGSYLTGNQTITLTGDVSGSGTTSIAVTIADDSHNHVISNVDGLQSALDGKASTSHNHTLDSLSNTTITSNTNGEILRWNGTAWVNNTLAEAGIQPAGTYNTVIGIDTDYSLTGATVFSGLTLTDGVIQGVATRNLTASDIGALSTAGKAADSNLLDGLDSSAFLRSNATDSASGRINFTSGIGINTATTTADIQFDNSFDTNGYDTGKIRLYDDTGASGDIYGFGISSGQLNYRSDGKHSFYKDTTKIAEIDGSATTGTLAVYGTNTEVFIGASNNGHGYLELGGPSGALIDMKSPFSDDFDTRIDLDASNNFGITSNGNQTFTSSGTSYYRSSNGIDITANYNTANAGNIVIEANNGQIYIQSWLTSNQGNIYINSAGARGGSGTILTTRNDSCAAVLRAGGYLEWITDVGAVGTTYFNSDGRLKDNVDDCTVDALPLIDQVAFKQFDWNEASGRGGVHEKLGFIAQDLQAIEPTWVDELSDGTLSVNSTQLISYLMKAVSELSAKNKDLESRIAALEVK